MSHPVQEVDVWSVEGQFQHLIYSPKGGIEGVMIATDGIATQFVTDPHDPAIAAPFAALEAGQVVVIEGIATPPSPKGVSAHTVYQFERLASVDGHAPAATRPPAQVGGTVVRFNYAKHGVPNGVVLDTGDFIHTKPDGLEKLGLQVGDDVTADGPAQPLATGGGRVVDAHRVNGTPLKPAP